MGQTRSREKTFLLGVGAQKCGTTWVSEYLRKDENTDFGALKEYHVWDVLSDPLFARYRPNLARQAIARAKQAVGVSLSPRELRHAMYANPAFYFSYFKRILAKPDVWLTGDITPSYTAVPATVFGKIKDEFAAAGVRVKALLLLRDPVERCWSALRMHKRRREFVGGIDISLSDEAALRQYYRTPYARARSSYDQIYSRLREAFGEEDIHVEFYERLFEPEAVGSISEYLGIQSNFSFVKHRFNASPKIAQISEPLRQEIVQEYSDIYHFAATKFPVTKDLWGGFSYLR